MSHIYGRVTIIADDYQDYINLLNAAQSDERYVIVMEDDTELRLVVDLI